jgi:hypothetical protein
MLFALLAVAVPIVLAFLVLGNMSASTYGDIWPTQGADTNGGMFDPSVLSLTDLAATVANTSAPVVTSASYNFVAGDVNHWVYVKSGTHWQAGWYQIASVAANAATLNASAGTYYTSNGLLGTITGCTSDGTATLSGGTWSVDYSHAAAAKIAVTDAVGNSTTTVTSATAAFTAAMVGNVIYGSGAGFSAPSRFTITVVTNATTITVDRSTAATGSGSTLNMGGALATASEAWTQGNGTRSVPGSGTCFMKGSVGNQAAIASHITFPNGTNTAPTRFIGYASIPGDLDAGNQFPNFSWTNFPVITQTGGVTAIFDGNANNQVQCRNFVLDGAGASKALKGMTWGLGFGSVDNMQIKNIAGVALLLNDGCAGQRIYITGCSTGPCVQVNSGGANNYLVDSIITGNTCTGINCPSSGNNINLTLERVIIANNTGASSDGIFWQTPSGGGGTPFNADKLVIYNNGRDGFRINGNAGGSVLRNCIIYGNAGWQINCTSTYPEQHFDYNAVGTGGSGAYTGITAGAHDQNLGANDPFVNGGGNNFATTNTAGGGRLCRGAGSTPNMDIGALQAPAGGGGPCGVAVFTGASIPIY